MNLQLITAETCPTCGAPTVMESCRLHHCNGQGFEERGFACGCVLGWVPNFEKLQVKTVCSQDPAEIAKVKRRAAAKDTLLEFIKKLDVDDVRKATYDQQIRWI